jgi:hypothetical protein
MRNEYEAYSEVDVVQRVKICESAHGCFCSTERLAALRLVVTLVVERKKACCRLSSGSINPVASVFTFSCLYISFIECTFGVCCSAFFFFGAGVCTLDKCGLCSYLSIHALGRCMRRFTGYLHKSERNMLSCF